MKCEWRNIRLSEITSLITKGTTPTSIGYSFTERGVNFVKSESITASRRLDKNKYCHISEITHERLKRSQLQVNDILFSMAGMFLGKTAIVTEEDLPANTNQAVAIIRIIPELADIKYIYYYLNQKEIVLLINSATGQSAQPNINLKQIGNLDIKLPDLGTQRKISAILNSIDEKIELNNKINANLQQQAQAIFKSWFVDFEPFQDGEFVESELGPIPKGWRVSNLLEIADYTNGLAMQKFRPLEGEDALPVLKIKELRQSRCDESSDLCSASIDPKYIVEDGDVVFSWSGTLMIDLWCGGKCGLNQHLFKITSAKYHKWFYYMWTEYHLQKFIAIAQDKATTMGHIKRGELKSSCVLIPEPKVYEKMTESISKIFDAIVVNQLENRNLIQLRDTLLPKLMNGEIDTSGI